MNESNVDMLAQMAQRLEDAAAALETAAVRVLEQQITLIAKAERPAPEEAGETIVATVDTNAEERCIAELERRLQQAECQLMTLRAAATVCTENGRKTSAAGVATMLAKQEGGVAAMNAAAMDGALATLSVEQRIAVKAELFRSGLIG